MKRLLAILLSFYFCTFSYGAAFIAHYCMDELAAVSTRDNTVCNTCGSEKQDDSCCKSEVKLLKTDNPQTSAVVQLKLQSFAFIVPESYFALPVFVPRDLSQNPSIRINAPPQLDKCPLYVWNCIYRI